MIAGFQMLSISANLGSLLSQELQTTRDPHHSCHTTMPFVHQSAAKMSNILSKQHLHEQIALFQLRATFPFNSGEDHVVQDTIFFLNFFH